MENFQRWLLKDFVIERIVAWLYISTQLIALYGSINQFTGDYFYVTFYSIRVLFLIIAGLFAIFRRSEKYYFAGFHEMTEEVYWRFIIMITFVMKGLFLRRFVNLHPTMLMFELVVVTVLIVLLLISYQGQQWTVKAKERNYQRIKYLSMEKAKLSKSELKAITPLLIELANNQQKQPLLWKMIKGVLIVIWGATLSSYASAFADFLNFDFTNFLPPY